ncbi:MAG: hypothetical protein KatS3mg056_1527 [Chloroflexus sp.]|nr:MAG: hypothetical protein KatS3mg056_1527 [Chloroflexus sp.]
MQNVSAVVRRLSLPNPVGNGSERSRGRYGVWFQIMGEPEARASRGMPYLMHRGMAPGR